MTTLVENPKELTPEYSKLSPFELKDLLIGMAEEAAKTRAAVMLNAGRGNPNWSATTPRDASALMLTFGLSEAPRSRDEHGVGLAGMPNYPGTAARFEQFLLGATGAGA